MSRLNCYKITVCRNQTVFKNLAGKSVHPV